MTENEIPSLDEATKEEINSLSHKELMENKGNTGIYHRYFHSIIRYGLNALAHVYLMQKALTIEADKDITNFLEDNKFILGETPYGSFTPDKIKDQFQYSRSKDGKFITPLNILENEGIFVPEHAYFEGDKFEPHHDRLVPYFDEDYFGMLYLTINLDELSAENQGICELSKTEAKDLVYRKWEPHDFKDKNLMMKGLQFGRDLWANCIDEFKRYNDQKPMPLTDSVQKLIDYYSAIIYAPIPSISASQKPSQ